MKQMKYMAGDLVEVCSRNRTFTGVIISSRPVSVYIEDRPYRIIDEVSYTIMANGTKQYVYGKDIHRKLGEENK